MTLTINLSLFQTPFPYIALYVFGFIIAANIAAVKYKRIRFHYYDDTVFEYGMAAIVWPLYVLVLWVLLPLYKVTLAALLLPSKLFSKELSVL